MSRPSADELRDLAYRISQLQPTYCPTPDLFQAAVTAAQTLGVTDEPDGLPLALERLGVVTVEDLRRLLRLFACVASLSALMHAWDESAGIGPGDVRAWAFGGDPRIMSDVAPDVSEASIRQLLDGEC